MLIFKTVPIQSLSFLGGVLIFATCLFPKRCLLSREYGSNFRALEKVDKEQLNRKRFEIHQTTSCFEAFLNNGIFYVVKISRKMFQNQKNLLHL